MRRRELPPRVLPSRGGFHGGGAVLAFRLRDKVVIEEDTLLLILKISSICGEACKKLTDRCVEVIVNSNVDLVTLDKSLPQHIVKEIVNLRNDLGIEVPEVGKHVLNIYKALDSDDVELVEMLLSEGHTNLDDAYALHFAVKYCDVRPQTISLT
ncbi:Regulatory protein NPR1 [Raphanus sativus]|nr:Regulatory protein NPR1 [Raphanus sativus]